MKRFIFSIIVIIVYHLSFCSFAAFSANRVDVTMYPEISEKFTAIKVGGEFRVIYSEASDTLKIIANEKVIQNLECVVEDENLIVRYQGGKSAKAILGGKAPIVYIPANPNIKKIILSGTTRMECSAPIVNENLSFNISGAARVIGEIKSSNVSIHCAGTVNVTITGSSDTVDIRIDGASRVAMGEGFESKTGNIDINGAGVVRLCCTEKITGEISGTSVVKYLGEPKVSIITNGLASVSAVE